MALNSAPSKMGPMHQFRTDSMFIESNINYSLLIRWGWCCGCKIIFGLVKKGSNWGGITCNPNFAAFRSEKWTFEGSTLFARFENSRIESKSMRFYTILYLFVAIISNFMAQRLLLLLENIIWTSPKGHWGTWIFKWPHYDVHPGYFSKNEKISFLAPLSLPLGVFSP